MMASCLRIHTRRNAAIPLFLLSSGGSSSIHTISGGPMSINRNVHTVGIVSSATSTLLSSSVTSSCLLSITSTSRTSSSLLSCSLFSSSSSSRMRPFSCSTTRLLSSSSSSPPSSPPPSPSSSLYTSTIISSEGMERLGEGLWEAGLAAGHTVLLYGDLGTGKTTLARGLIQAATAAGEEGEGGREGAVAVTSPSYLLDNSYQACDGETGDIFMIHHMDLYRLSMEKHDLKILGFPLVLEEALCLIEWPERLGSYTPTTRLEINLSALDENTRTVVIRGVGGGWADEVVRRLEDVMNEE
ncbi:hypothetical protein VYU27_009589 [Nannochloropsis oceanica]